MVSGWARQTQRGDAPDGKTKKQLDSELVWLITMYVLYVWDTFQIPSRHIPDMSDTL